MAHVADVVINRTSNCHAQAHMAKAALLPPRPQTVTNERCMPSSTNRSTVIQQQQAAMPTHITLTAGGPYR
jgi:hypothetical protein